MVFKRDTEAFAIDRAADAAGLIHRAIDLRTFTFELAPTQVTLNQGRE